MKRSVAIILTVLMVIVLLVTTFYTPLRLAITNFFAQNNVVTVDNLLREEKWFYTQYESIKSKKVDLESDEKELEKNPSDSLRDSIYAQKKIINQLVAEYNAKSDSYSSQLFRDKELPYKLELVK